MTVNLVGERWGSGKWTANSNAGGSEIGLYCYLEEAVGEQLGLGNHDTVDGIDYLETKSRWYQCL
jgi:hypothetical protein